MSEEELIEILKEFEKSRVEQLKEPSRNLFYAIMKIADERDKYKIVLDKIKEWKKQTLFDLNRQYKTFEYWEELFEDLDKILEEI